MNRQNNGARERNWREDASSIFCMNREWLSVIRAKINGRYTTILIDTGSNLSAINVKMARNLNLRIAPISNKDPVNLYAANGQPIVNRGSVVLPVEINGVIFRQQFLVLDGLTTGVICGCNFLRDHKAVVDMGGGTIIFNETLTIPLIRKQEYVGVVRMIHEIRIPPRRKELVMVSLNRGRKHDRVYLLDLPDPVRGIKITTKSCWLDRVMHVMIENETTRPIYLKSFAPIASCIRVLKDSEQTKLEEGRERTQGETPEQRKKRIMELEPSKRTIEDLELVINKDNYIKEDITEFKQVLRNNTDLFALSNSELPACKWIKAVFRLKDPNSKPVRGKVFSHSKEAREEIDRQVAQLLKDGFIERSCSPFTSSVMLVKKKDGTLRMVQDNRPINKLLEDEIFVPNTLAEIFEKVGAENPLIFSSVDLRSAYQQIEIEEGPSRDYSAFVCSTGCYRFSRMSFGMKSAPAKFMLLMSMVIGTDPMLQRNCIPYLDDILLFTRTLADHTEVLRRLCKALREAGLKIHPGKCEFLQKSVKYVGHIFSAEGIAPDPKKLDAMMEFPRPKTKKNLKSFLGMVQFYRTYHKDLSRKIVPLLKLLKKDEKFVWTAECEDAFQQVREGLRTMPILSYPDETVNAGRYIIQVDASQTAVAGTLSQATRDGTEEKLICCFGRRLAGSELAWPVCDKEGASLMIALLRWKHLLLGNPGLEIRSDNMSVKFLERIKHATSPRLARWSTAMSPILSKATWTHVPGTKNVVADALSRREYEPEDPVLEEEDLLHDDLTFGALHTEPDKSDNEEESEDSNEIQEVVGFEEYWNSSWENALQSQDDQDWTEIGQLLQTQEPENSEEGEIWICFNKNKQTQGQDDQFIRSLQDHVTAVVCRAAEERINEINRESNEVSREAIDTSNGETEDKEIGVEICAENSKDFVKLQRACSELGPLMRYLETGEIREGESKEMRRILTQAEWHFLDEEGVLCSTTPRMTKVGNSHEKEYRVVPKCLREELMDGFHQFGHCGISRLQELILKSSYRWERMFSDIRNFVLSCKACSISKRGIIAPKAKLKPLEIPEKAGDVIQMDIIGPFSASKEGHIAVLSVIDRLTSYVWLFPLKNCTSETIAKKLFKVFCDIGTPKIIISDNATNLVSKVIKDMADRLGITRVNTTPYHSPSNGLCERAHRTVADNLRALLSESDITHWNTKIPEILWGLRSAVSTRTKRSPYELRHGQQMTFPIERRIERGIDSARVIQPSYDDLTEYARNLEARIKTIHDAHRIKLKEEQVEMKSKYDEKIRKTYKYQVGDRVYLKDPTGTLGISRKLQPEYYKDVFEVIETSGDHNVKLRNTVTNKELHLATHVDRLKPVVERTKASVSEDSATDTDNEKETTETIPEASTDRTREETTEDIVYRIVQQKGFGDDRRFRVQWKEPNGRSKSCWETLDNVTAEMLAKWERSHGRTGRTLRTFKRSRN